VAQVVGAPHLLVSAIGDDGIRLVVGAVVVLVLGGKSARRLRDGTPGPPAAECTGNAAYQSSDRAGGGADAGTHEYAGDAPSRLAHFVADAWL